MPNKPKTKTKKALVLAALALLVLAVDVYAQQKEPIDVIKEAPFMDTIKGGLRILLALIGFASMTAMALLAIYAFVMYVLGPTHWYRWQALISVVENFKWLIVGAAAFPFAIAAAVYGINVVLGGYDAKQLSVTPQEVAVKMLEAIYVEPFRQAFDWVFG
ncbi:hypothetical protein [Pyrobaculum sp.]|uniref:hypothetical protein n=1 Tax=Pyrobaculum sp. TaxID=2004705 RepID=UPI00316737F3